VSVLNLALWAAGAILVVVGYVRARPYLERSNALRDQEANTRRYEEWRGRSRFTQPAGQSSAELMSAELRRRAYTWMGVAGAGVVVAILGFAVR
jgi:hypothetical protein